MAAEQGSEVSAGVKPVKTVDPFQRLEKQSKLHLWLAVIGIPLMMVTMMAGLVALVELKKSTDGLLQEKPEGFVGSYSSKISAVKGRAAAQYQQYFQQMEDNSDIAGSIRLGQIYQLGLASESAYVDLLANYQQLNYELASRVKGSGEWYYYFKKSLDDAADKAAKRQSAMAELLLEPAI
jgi:hypothetical protein